MQFDKYIVISQIAINDAIFMYSVRYIHFSLVFSIYKANAIFFPFDLFHIVFFYYSI